MTFRIEFTPEALDRPFDFLLDRAETAEGATRAFVTCHTACYPSR